MPKSKNKITRASNRERDKLWCWLVWFGLVWFGGFWAGETHSLLLSVSRYTTIYIRGGEGAYDAHLQRSRLSWPSSSAILSSLLLCSTLLYSALIYTRYIHILLRYAICIMRHASCVNHHAPDNNVSTDSFIIRYSVNTPTCSGGGGGGSGQVGKWGKWAYM